ncbi:unnamed protein product [Rhizophagus irregularis]|nr:unnamed protein product [Rhizophagus irregularis]
MNNKPIPDDFEDVLDDMDEEERNQLDVDTKKPISLTKNPFLTCIVFLMCIIRKQNKNFYIQTNCPTAPYQKILTAAEYNRKRAIYEYLKRLGENGKGKMKTSKEAAQLIFIDCAPYRARSIQYWANFWLQHNRLPVSRIYYDGHERPDVVEYRKSFLDEIYSYEKYMAKYEGETMEQIPPILESDDKEVILVTHDECIFYSNDGKRGVWAKSGELPLRKKGNGRLIMVSEFLLEECGRLKLNIQQHQENPFIPEEVRVYLQPGKDREGYWTSEHLINQIKTKAIPIFETLFPNCIALFAFDNSSNHAAFNPDALVANKMNLKPGSK